MAQTNDNGSDFPSSPEYHLILYSHGRSPPLLPAPDLKYDLRNIPNPPKALREVSDGRSKRLREHLLSETKFVNKLRDVEADIRRVMQDKAEEWELKKKQTEQRSEINGDKNCNEAHEDRTQKHSEVMDQKDEEEDGSENEDEDEGEDGSETELENAITLRVGCNCALGHHRSVAFVHELSQLPWPKEWHLEVMHRDLEVKRAGGTRERQKVQFRDQKRGFSEHGEA